MTKNSSPRWIALVAMVLVPTVSEFAAPQSGSPPASSLTATTLIDTYCIVCHSTQAKTAGVALEGIDANDVAENAALWERVLRKTSTRQMPPAGMPHPSEADYKDFTKWLESTLDASAAAHPNPGQPVVHRLNRNEYSNAIRDLLALDIDAGSMLPLDDTGYGFDNIGEVLSMSPVLTERYLSVAGKISRLAVGNTDLKPVATVYTEPREPYHDGSIQHKPRNERASEDAPFGSTGGFSFTHYFPVDASYTIKIQMLAEGAFGSVYNRAADENFTITLPVKAGPHTLTTDALMDDPLNEQTSAGGNAAAGPGRGAPGPAAQKAPLELRLDGVRLKTFDFTNYFQGVPDIADVTVTGPYEIKGPGDTGSRRAIFVCKPATSAEEEPCARKIVSGLARRAFRRPVTNADLQPLLAVYRAGRKDSDFNVGIETAIQAILVSPEFLFRAERDSPGTASGTHNPGVRKVSDLELASRLSFFLWSSIPDEQLLALAEQGKLGDPAILRQQVSRMMKDPKSSALVTNFAGQWLYLREVAHAKPNVTLYPSFDYPLRESMRRETELFFDAIYREDRPVTELLSANFTFLNQRLAEHYGIPGIQGSRFRRVELTDASLHRGGLLGQASILLVTSYDNRTSVVQRGKWILDNLLGAPPPPPPPNVPALEASQKAGQKQTVRELMEAHRANPVCAACHTKMDPIGFALENYDPIGQWREKDAGAPVDARGKLPDGTEFEGPTGLRDLLLNQHKDEFLSAFGEKLFTYALGRGIEAYDRPAWRAVIRQAAAKNYTIASYIEAIINSPEFQMRRIKDQ